MISIAVETDWVSRDFNYVSFFLKSLYGNGILVIGCVAKQRNV